MRVHLNGSLVPAEEARISVFDRGFLYGDGLFETFRAYRGRLFLWDLHRERLRRGLEELRLPLPHGLESIPAAALELLRANQLSDASLRLSISRGPGLRGYSARGSGPSTIVLMADAAPPFDGPQAQPVRLHTSGFRVPSRGSLAAHKTASKLLHVMARMEAESAGADEALLLNESGAIAETVATNIFWFDPDGLTISTPDLSQGALAGVTRQFVLELLRGLGWPVRTGAHPPEALHASMGAFLTVSTRGLIEVDSLDGRVLRRDPRFERLSVLYRDAVLNSISG
jgi:branched-subunit amino acid aminotransferase/4-amino-4-deoxychorismate lyase